jgi:poly-gamma-glutamate synthesis protein (capsule biosynthesis protein)
MSNSGFITLFFSGDVMTGRGIDQVLPYAGDPTLYQSNRKSAEDYIKLAENVNGPIPRPVDFSYIWGDAIEILEKNAPDLRIINLETSVTKSNDFMKGKAIHYKMHPGNIFCLTAANIDICVLANNHLLDWGYEGLMETLQTLKNNDIKFAGAGCNLQEAEVPVAMNIPGKGRVIVFSYCSITSGVPLNWAAEKAKPGVNLLPDLSDETIRQIKEKVKAVKQQSDFVVASIHWGSNWGYNIPYEQRKFAYALIDKAGIDMIHGHSSHHPRPMEIYKGKLIMFGAGDFINDYEGIFRIDWRKLKYPWKLLRLSRYRKFRIDLILMYFVSVDLSSGKLNNLKIIPMQLKKFRLSYPSQKDVDWLQNRMNKIYKKFNLQLELKPALTSGNINNTLLLRW